MYNQKSVEKNLHSYYYKYEIIEGKKNISTFGKYWKRYIRDDGNIIKEILNKP